MHHLKDVWKEVLAGLITFLVNISKGIPDVSQIIESLILGGLGWVGALLFQMGCRALVKLFKKEDGKA